ncbi:MAG: aldehyde dehydrogenase family protein [Chthoniobacterales bacterium]
MQHWQNRNPANLDDALPEISASDVETAVANASASMAAWARTPLAGRIAALRECQAAIRAKSENLAQLITRETGKPIVETRGELGAVVAKFDLTIADAEEFVADRAVADGPHPALVRSKPRGPAAVIAPFNFPIHLGHGATVAYLLAGNPVLYKPSPLAAATGNAYGKLMAAALPPGVFQIVQGWGETGRALCLHSGVRSVCFTGSIPVGTALAKDLAADYSKSLALELGGKCAGIVCADANLEQAADDIAQAAYLTAGQRCNATSLAYVHESLVEDFLGKLDAALGAWSPGDPQEETTKLGPVVSAAALERYQKLLALGIGEPFLPGGTPEFINAKRGHWATPAVVCCHDFEQLAKSSLFREESFCPILAVVPFTDDADAVRMHNTSPFGLTSSIFTADRARFDVIGEQLRVGNLYWNLPTTFSPSTLPFGGLGISGNGKPGARGFIRFAADEQAVQWRKQ